MKDKCIILTGGGTAGHVTLNINLKDELSKHFEQIVYIGSKNGIEKKLVTENTNYNFKEITTTKLTRKKFLKNLTIPFKLIKGVKEAKKLIQEYKPSIIFSKGGYVGLPVVIAGKQLGIPVVCHESDISMGLANKLAKKYASKICTNFKKTAAENGKKCIHTGMPLKLSNLTKSQAKDKLKIKTNKPVLLVTGGSLGSKILNEFIFKNIDELTDKYYVIHLVGKNNYNKKINKPDYKQIEFSNDMWTIFRASDYAISRAGANTIVELLSNQILTILVPLSKKVSRGDQIENSKYLENNKLCKYIEEDELSIKKVQNLLSFLENNSNIFKNNIKYADFTDGTKNIAKIILQEKKAV